jgi:hypothetical protein
MRFKADIGGGGLFSRSSITVGGPLRAMALDHHATARATGRAAPAIAARKSAFTITLLARICSAMRKSRHGGKITAA